MRYRRVVENHKDDYTSKMTTHFFLTRLGDEKSPQADNSHTQLHFSDRPGYQGSIKKLVMDFI